MSILVTNCRPETISTAGAKNTCTSKRVSRKVAEQVKKNKCNVV
jgi:hypothetical protein